MKRASVTIAHSQQTPTTASAVSRTCGLISPACSRPCSMTFLRRPLRIGRSDGDDHHDDDQRGHDEIDRAPRNPRRQKKAKAPPTMEAVR